MKIFLAKTLGIAALTITLLVLSLIYIPDHVAKNNLLGALTDKHELLRQPSPKIIFNGGSNVSLGLDSKRVADQFHLPVVNTGIHAGIGLRYIVNDIKPFIQAGDIVVLMPEYAHFFTNSFYGHMELVSILFDIYPEGKSQVNGSQWFHLSEFMPTYAAKKIKNLFVSRPHLNDSVDVYGRRSFNAYGDAYRHWTLPGCTLPKCTLPIAKKCDGTETVNPEVISFLVDFRHFVESKNARLIILPPVFSSPSFQNQQFIINKIDAELTKNGIPFSASPERYKLEEDFFFDTEDHMNKTGVDLRTSLVLEDLNRVLRSAPLNKP